MGPGGMPLAIDIHVARSAGMGIFFILCLPAATLAMVMSGVCASRIPMRVSLHCRILLWHEERDSGIGEGRLLADIAVPFVCLAGE